MIKPNTFNESLLREKIIELALMQLNKKYKHGFQGPTEFDCAGFVWYVYNQIMNIDIFDGGYGKSTTTMTMTSRYGIFKEHKDTSLIKEGDILFFHLQSKKEDKPTEINKYPGHCAIYLGNSNFIHCTGKPGYVLTDNLDNNKKLKKVLVGSKDIVSNYK